MRVLVILVMVYALVGCASAERYQMEVARAQAHAQLVQADNQLSLAAVQSCGDNAWCALVQAQQARDNRPDAPEIYEHPGWRLANTVAGGVLRVGETWIRVDGTTRQTIGLVKELKGFQGAHTDNRVITTVGGDQVGGDQQITTQTAGGDIAGRDHLVDTSTHVGGDSVGRDQLIGDQYQDSTNAAGDIVSGDKYTDSCSSGDECYNASPDESSYTDSGTRDNDYSDNRQYSEEPAPLLTP